MSRFLRQIQQHSLVWHWIANIEIWGCDFGFLQLVLVQIIYTWAFFFWCEMTHHNANLKTWYSHLLVAHLAKWCHECFIFVYVKPCHGKVICQLATFIGGTASSLPATSSPWRLGPVFRHMMFTTFSADLQLHDGNPYLTHWVAYEVLWMCVNFSFSCIAQAVYIFIYWTFLSRPLQPPSPESPAKHLEEVDPKYFNTGCDSEMPNVGWWVDFSNRPTRLRLVG